MKENFDIEKIRNLIKKDKINLSIESIWKAKILSGNIELVNQLLLIENRLNSQRQRLQNGIITEPDFNAAKTKIIQSLISLTREIEEHTLELETSSDYFEKLIEDWDHNQNLSNSRLLQNIELKDLDEKLVNSFFDLERVNQKFIRNALDQNKVSLIEKFETLNLCYKGHFTKAVFLCLGSGIDKVSRFLPQAKFTVFSDNEGLAINVHEYVSGNLVSQYNQIIDHLRNNLYLRRDIFKSKEDFEIPYIVFKEVLANAFIHAEYENQVSSIQVELYPNRLEIKNPGNFPRFIDLNKLNEIEVSLPRNPRIAFMFYLFNIVDTVGKGIKRIIHTLRANGFKPPVYSQEINKNYVKVIIYKKNDESQSEASAKFEFQVISNQLDTSLKYHSNISERWSSEVSFRGLYYPKTIDSIYVKRNLVLSPTKLLLEGNAIEEVSFEEAVEVSNNNHLLIFGPPGVGKTTFVKWVAREVKENKDFLDGNYENPIIIKLRDLNILGNDFALFESLSSILGLQYLINDKVVKQVSSLNPAAKQLIKDSVIKTLEEIRAFLMLDGLDEVASEIKSDLTHQIRELSLGLKNSKMLLTTRSGDLSSDIGYFSYFELSNLSGEQIKAFINKWIPEEKEANGLLKQLKNSPFYDTLLRPLTLAHICAVYERYGTIPSKPKTVYKIVIELLLKEWDAQRSIRRTSKYSKFEINRKYDFLTHLAYLLTTRYSTSKFSKELLRESYLQICKNFNLPTEEVEQVIMELESHNGLILRSGFETYEFAHKSIQEYLTADFIAKLPMIPKDYELLEKIPNELAIVVSISSNPSLYFLTLTLGHFTTNMNFQFINDFYHRLVLEKPDFTREIDIGLSVVCIISQYLKNNKAIGSNFDDILNNEVIFNSMKMLLEEYFEFDSHDIRQVQFHSNFEEIYQLTRSKDISFSSYFEYQVSDIWITKPILERLVSAHNTGQPTSLSLVGLRLANRQSSAEKKTILSHKNLAK